MIIKERPLYSVSVLAECFIMRVVLSCLARHSMISYIYIYFMRNAHIYPLDTDLCVDPKYKHTSHESDGLLI